jgi:hypothetical protein
MFTFIVVCICLSPTYDDPIQKGVFVGIILGFFLFCYDKLADLYDLNIKETVRCVKILSIHLIMIIILPFAFTGLGYVKDCLFEKSPPSYEIYFVGASLLFMVLIPLAVISSLIEISQIRGKLQEKV